MRFLLYHVLLTLILIATLPLNAQTTAQAGDHYDYYMHRDSNRPLKVNPHKWKQQPKVNSWDSMEQAYKEALQNQDGYGIFQLAYLEFIHKYTLSNLNPKTMLYRAFEIGKAKGDPYLMYWVTEFEGEAFYHFEYLERRRHHAAWTDSVATEKKEWPVLHMLSDLNDISFAEMKKLSRKYIQCAYLKNETYGLLNYNIRSKIMEMELNLRPK